MIIRFFSVPLLGSTDIEHFLWWNIFLIESGCVQVTWNLIFHSLSLPPLLVDDTNSLALWPSQNPPTLSLCTIHTFPCSEVGYELSESGGTDISPTFLIKIKCLQRHYWGSNIQNPHNAFPPRNQLFVWLNHNPVSWHASNTERGV